MRAGLIQITSTDDPQANLPVTLGLIREAAAKGALARRNPTRESTSNAASTRSQRALAPVPALAAVHGRRTPTAASPRLGRRP